MIVQLNRIEHIEWLSKNVSEDTVIDDNWFGYFYDNDILFHLMIATGFTSYKEIMGVYEGYTIPEMLNEIMRQIHIQEMNQDDRR